MPNTISGRAKIRWINTMSICWITMISPAQAAKRPTVLAIPSNPRTQPHMNSFFQMPTAVSTRNTVKTTKKNSTEPP